MKSSKARSGVTGRSKAGQYTGERGPQIPVTTRTKEEITREAVVLQGLTPQQVALFAAMLVNGGNITRAARSVGMNGSYARRLVAKEGPFREAIRAYGDGMRTCLEEWLDLVPRAKAAMVRLLNDPDGKVQYLAAKDILDRAEGKAVSRSEIRVRDERPILNEGEVQLAFALMQRKGIGYAQAVDLIRQNPEDAAQWIAANVVATSATPPALPPGKLEPEDEQVLPEPEDEWARAAREPEEETDEDAPRRTKGRRRGKGKG